MEHLLERLTLAHSEFQHLESTTVSSLLLREALSGYRVTLPELGSRFQPRRLNSVRAALGERDHEVAAFAFDPPTIDHLKRELEHEWHDRKSLSKLSRRQLRAAPWLIGPTSDSTHSLVEDRQFLTALLGEFERRRDGRAISVLMHVFMLFYPEYLSTFEILREGLMKLISRLHLPSLVKWISDGSEVPVLDSNAARQLSSECLLHADSLQVLSEYNVSKGLENGSFSQAIFREMVRSTGAALRAGNGQLESLTSVLTFAEDSGRLRFPILKCEFIETMLVSADSGEVRGELREKLLNEMLRLLGDPRIASTGWHGIDDQAQSIVRKWLVGATLKGFFELIRTHAYDTHWSYREAFWGYYHKHGLIVDAWCALGRSASTLALKDKSGAFARHAFLDCSDKTKSALLLRIGNLIVVEFSHSGACRVWNRGTRGAPVLYRPKYHEAVLWKAPDEGRVVHQGSDVGRWQSTLSSLIAGHIGFEPKIGDLMPRGKR